MRWIEVFSRHKPKLNDHQKARLQSWQALPRAQTPAELDRARFVVIDVETSGLNLLKDNLIAIGAVAVVNGKLDMEDSFEMVLQQSHISSKQNILVHGITGVTQVAGQVPGEVLLAFLEYLQKDPLVAFHVTFDETMLSRAIKQYLGFSFKHDWLDLAYVAPGLYPELSQRLRALDDWLGYFQIQNYARHNALADAVSTAQLLMVVSKFAAQKNIADYQALRCVEKSQRWVEGR
ncbi:MAG: 3'-5' exonuclease [Gallionella sp.]